MMASQGKSADVRGWRLNLALAGLVLAVVVAILPPPAGLPTAGQRILAVMVGAIALWVSEAVVPAVTGVLIMIALPLMGVLPFPKETAEFGSPTIALLAAVFFIGRAVQNSGLDRRLALTLVNWGKGRVSLAVLLMMATTFLFAFFVPSSMARAALMAPIAAGLVEGMGLGRESNLGKALFIAIPLVTLISSSGLLTGTTGMVYAAGVFENTLGYHWNYLHWLVAFMPGSVLSVVLVWVALLRLFPPEKAKPAGGSAGGADYLAEQLAKLGPLSAIEKKTLLVLVALVAGWATEGLHGVSTSLVGVTAATLLLLPGVGVLKWKETVNRVDWGSIILFGTSLVLAKAMSESGAAKWIAETFTRVHSLGPVGAVLAVTALFALLRVGLSNMTAVLALGLPVIFSTAAAMHLNPLWLGMVGAVTCALGFFFPTQSVSLMTSYGYGYFRVQDLVKAGLAATVIVAGVTLLMATQYWPLLGISPLGAGH